MNERVLIDTNILIYYIDKESIFNSVAEQIIDQSDYDLYITSKNISEICAVLSKDSELNHEIILRELDNLINSFKILYPSLSSINIFKKLFGKYKQKGNRAYGDDDYQSFKYPSGVYVDSSGNIYVADTPNHRISKWKD